MQITLTEATQLLHTDKIIAVPTEAVYGFSCLPTNLDTIQTLLTLKQREWHKGLILVASELTQLEAWVDWQALTHTQYQRVLSRWPGPVTWLVPAAANVSDLIKGVSLQIAVRVTNHPILKTLCAACQSPLISTSANLAGHPAAKTTQEIEQQFGINFPILQGALGQSAKPSAIFDAITGEQYR